MSDPEPTRVRAMFERIAPRYDLMNRLMTLGMDGGWRRATAAALTPSGDGVALDVGCGTGDLARALLRAGAGTVVGLDPVAAMLGHAVVKAPPLRAVVGDALALPMADGSCELVASAFVMRNVSDLDAALLQSMRVLRPGGRLGILELTRSSVAPVRFYFHRVVPLLGGVIAGDRGAYSYLPASVDRFPDADALAGLMAAAGFKNIRYRKFMFGMVALHIGQRAKL